MKTKQTNKSSAHVIKAEKLLKKHGLEGNDWCSASYIKDPPDEIIYYESDAWIVLPYKNGKWTEDKLWFKSKEEVLKFGKVCKCKIEEMD